MRARRIIAAIAGLAMTAAMLALPGCETAGEDDMGTTSGPAYTEPDTLMLAPFNEGMADSFAGGNAAIDDSQTENGYVGARASTTSRCKLQVACGDMSYNYDLPEDGTPIIVPLNMGNGSYTFRVMQNTTGNSYVEIGRTGKVVQMTSRFDPFLRPNVYCEYGPTSDCVERAFMLAADAENEGDVVRSVYDWLIRHISYDNAKADELADTTGYVPDPEATLEAGKGICFDYASLAAAMFRSLGIPCEIVTGYVSPDDIYHAWNMIYIDGEWVSASISVVADTWCRVDVTLGAAASSAGSLSTVGDGVVYTERYIY